MSGNPGAPPAATRWLVDGFNVVRVAGLARDTERWWGVAARERLLRASEELPGAPAVCVVFDGKRQPEPGELELAPHLEVVFARSADEWILKALRAEPVPECITVVTADRRLADRVRRRRGRVLAPGAFLELCAGVDRGVGAARKAPSEEPCL